MTEQPKKWLAPVNRICPVCNRNGVRYQGHLNNRYPYRCINCQSELSEKDWSYKGKHEKKDI